MNNTRLISIFLRSLEGRGAERATSKQAVGLAERDIPVDLVLAKGIGPYLAAVFHAGRHAYKAIRSAPPCVADRDSVVIAMLTRNTHDELHRRYHGIPIKRFCKIITLGLDEISRAESAAYLANFGTWST
jgi:hypothetical protein